MEAKRGSPGEGAIGADKPAGAVPFEANLMGGRDREGLGDPYFKTMWLTLTSLCDEKRARDR